ncbi:MAG: chromosome segregation protein SMC, partial [Demequinaceae bacterium]|nr:chromosome segregation protein SMC [Demequinaceae bacterium]
LEFEPGITCVVGPNGSGKSNVVDALAWVMGEQGAKTLRGGNMSDVIFAGTSGRPPLGRAEVALTIDNSDGALPIEYTEVTISRTLFRSGGSEYAINGNQCRLLDIQDLLSDSGLGREMHVIVGQGQLDGVLRATPEERRHFIEEAAGILKHRRRKEKALRKLDAMQGNLTRVQDLTSEIRRQLGPLGKQAEVARQAQSIQSEVRDARSRLLADDIAMLTTAIAKDQADETAINARKAQVDAGLAEAKARMAELELAAAEATPALTKANDIYYRLTSQRERLRNLGTLAEERVRMLGSAVDSQPVTDLVEMAEQLERAHAAREELDGEVREATTVLASAETTRAAAEQAADASERHLANLLRSVADRREGVARLAGDVAARRSRVEAMEAEIGRLREAHDAALRRANEATTEFQRLETTVIDVERGEEDLDAAHEAAVEALDEVKERLERLRQGMRDAERERDTWAAKAEALSLSLARKDGAGELLAAGVHFVRGTVASQITVRDGAEDAIAAALGPLAEAVAVDSVDDAVDAIRWLRDEDAGRARFVVSDAAAVTANPDVALPPGAEWASDLIEDATPLAATVRAFLGGVAIVEDLAAARALVAAHPNVIAVTRRGDLLGSRTASGGAGDAPSIMHLQAAYDDACHKRDAAAHQAEQGQFALRSATEEEQRATAAHEGTLARLNESDARMSAVAEQLGHLSSSSRSAQADAERLGSQMADASARIEATQGELAELVARLGAAQAEPEQTEADTKSAQIQRDEDSEAAQMARAKETEARLALRTAEERSRALAARAESLERTVSAERDARERAEEAAQRRQKQARAAREVMAGVAATLPVIDVSVAKADDARADVESRRSERTTALAEVRAHVDQLAGEYGRLTNESHRDEVMRAQQQVRLDQLNERAIDQLGMDPAQLVEEFGPQHDVPVIDDEGNETAEPFVREAQEKRLRHAERALGQLGRVNPLALEEFSALEERHKFLQDQLADIKSSREDLLSIVTEIDQRVEQIFTEAFNDTAAQFELIFPRLFPGGEGRLVLTDPKNMLETGIDVEARPAGKKVKRLSLLSGGERSLTAVAMLVSIFKARPSPFYVMDEVEAALDDTNLGRLLEIIRELRDESQLIVITHQKRTMEVADALYGITMRGDGVTTVISQRMGDDAA